MPDPFDRHDREQIKRYNPKNAVFGDRHAAPPRNWRDTIEIAAFLTSGEGRAKRIGT
jgi:hypothetical protein